MNQEPVSSDLQNQLDRRALIAGIGGLAAGAALFARDAVAGPLTPPPGPIGSTGRTVQEIYDKIARTDMGLAEPRIPVQSLPGSSTALHVISQPGSYYLTGNIIGEADKNGIHIEASSVNLDLAGFTMSGPNGLIAIVTNPGTRGLSIRNGLIQDWPLKAISARQSNQGRLEQLFVMRCGAEDPGDPYSIRCGESWIAKSCVVSSCTRWGLAIESGVIQECIAHENSGQGLKIVRGLMSKCVAFGNSDAGLSADESCIVHECSAYLNTFGIVCGFGCLTQSNLVYSNAIGVVTLGRRSRVLGNICFFNGIGLDVRGEASTIEENCCAENSEIGLKVQSAENMIVSNTMNGNGTNVSMAAGNSHGPIVNVAGVGDITSVPGADHPWANFIY